MSLKSNSGMTNYYKSIIKLLLFAMLLWGCSTQAQKQEEDVKNQRMSPSVIDWFKAYKLPDNLQIQGFASQAFISTSNNS